jgi:hypothetical protein
MSFPRSPGRDSAAAFPDGDWNALLAGAVGASDISGPLGNVIRLFGELGFAAHLADPANARDQCIAVSVTFASICTRRGISAETLDGFLLARIPPFGKESVVWGHTAVRATADGQGDTTREVVIDWTLRQFDAAAPVPLIVTLAGWRLFWRDIT